jgi:hypothetical protein
MRWSLVLFSFLLSGAAASAQSVISVRSGLINYSEGAVFIDNQLVAQKLGKYPAVHEGSDLLTQDGRAEILLTPEVYLRVGMNSGVRMISSSLADTRIQLLHGSAVLDSGNAKMSAPITLVACDSKILMEKPSRLRVDSDPPQLRIETGEAVVEHDGTTTRVGPDQMLALTNASVVRRMTDATDDELDLWSQQRNRLIFLSLANDRNILDPGSPDYPDTGGGDLSAWLGYMPPAAILPLTGSYGAVAMPGYGYYSPWSTLAFYGPLYGGYPLGYPGYYGAAGGYGMGGYGMAVGYVYRPVLGYRYIPGATGIYSPRPPAGGFRIGTSATPGFTIPRPVTTRPAMPHLPAHR